MNKKIKMNKFLHSLLVIKKLDNFTITEAKNVLVALSSDFHDHSEARKFIYRQLTRQIDKGLIERRNESDKNTNKVIYSKTEKFFESSFEPTLQNRKPIKKMTRPLVKKNEKSTDYQKELNKELLAYEIDLNTTLEEAKEYNRLSTRFPELQEQLQAHQYQAKDKSIKLLGKVHALQNLLGYSVTGDSTC